MKSGKRAFTLLFFMLLPVSPLLAAPKLPPGTNFILAANDPVTARVEDIPIWPGVAPGSAGVNIQEIVEESAINPSRGVRGVSKPAMQLFAAVKPTGVAVLVLPGGGYRQIVWDKEGVEVARWLNGLGIDAYVLKYRLPNEGHENGRLVPLQDAQRALRLIRARKSVTKVGAIGFSAGGHLAGMIGTTYGARYYESLDAADTLSARPDFLVLVYTPTGGAQSSILNGIDANSPPVFIVHGAGDSKVPAKNATDIHAAFRNAGVPAEVHVFPNAEHGFALRGSGPEKEWPMLCEAWLRQLGMLPGDRPASR